MRALAVRAPAVVEPVQVTGPSSDRLDLVLVGDGYTSDELATYAAHVQAKWQAIASIEPLQTYRGYFNVWRVDVVSGESGVDNDHPASVKGAITRVVLHAAAV